MCSISEHMRQFKAQLNRGRAIENLGWMHTPRQYLTVVIGAMYHKQVEYLKILQD
jgi:hypothetical protein